ncbi:MAG: glycosyltransferase [Clostridium sp.]|nr:glycosyltransferase [Clostridium sp.]
MEKNAELWPKVSVVTVCYNDREGLELTVRNVARQDYPNLEYIVVDGGSTDGSRELLDRYASSITRSVSEPDCGIYDAMNKGVAMASGEFVIFMNAGDRFAADDVVCRVFAQAEARRGDVVYGDVIKGGVVKRAGEPKNCHRMFFCHQCCFGRRQLLLDTPFDTAHRMSADFKWVKSMIRQGRRFVRTDVAVADFDTSGVSNRCRSAGLLDNIRVVREMDTPAERLRLLPRLIFPYILCRLRGK